MTHVVKKKAGLPPIATILLVLLSSWGLHQLVGRLNQRVPALTLTQARISVGDQVLISAYASSEKQIGAQAFADRNYSAALTQFQAALKRHRNDPESLIYLNNAKLGGMPSLKIAVSVPIGSNLNVAQEILRGVAQAQDEVNQVGGINGVGLQVAIANDENDPAIAVKIATKLVQDAQVLAVVGHNSSNASVAAAPIYQTGQLVMISPSSSSNQLSGFGGYIFRTIPATRFLSDPLADYIVKTARKSRLAVCFDSQAPDNITFKDELMPALVANGGTLIPLDCDFAAATFNPKVAIAQAISNGADAMLLTPHVDRIQQAMALAQANQGRLALFSSPTLYTIQTLQAGASAVNGLVLPVVWHPKQAAHSFPQRAFRYWGGTVNWRTATAYDATQAIIAGLKQSSTRTGLQTTLKAPGFFAPGAGKPIQFLPSGDRLSSPILVQIQPTLSGYDFVPIKP